MLDIKCYQCKGDGYVVVKSWRGFNRKKDCGYCKGTGLYFDNKTTLFTIASEIKYLTDRISNVESCKVNK
jgi:DnaJ-class molecular chaperone